MLSCDLLSYSMINCHATLEKFITTHVPFLALNPSSTSVDYRGCNLGFKSVMIPSRNILRTPLRLTAAAVFQYLKPNETPSISRHLPPSISHVQRFSADSAATESPRPTRCSELTRVATLVDGCDYQHWLVVVEPPEGYPERSQIVDHFITTLALALGSEEEAKRSIYSVSTKYYYAFGCKVSENLIHKPYPM